MLLASCYFLLATSCCYLPLMANCYFLLDTYYLLLVSCFLLPATWYLILIYIWYLLLFTTCYLLVATCACYWLPSTCYTITCYFLSNTFYKILCVCMWSRAIYEVLRRQALLTCHSFFSYSRLVTLGLSLLTYTSCIATLTCHSWLATLDLTYTWHVTYDSRES